MYVITGVNWTGLSRHSKLAGTVGRIDRMIKGQEKKKYWTGSQDKQDFI